MSTRACYTFLDTFSRGETRSFHVYKHHDGYPYAQCHTGEEAGALVWIRDALFMHGSCRVLRLMNLRLLLLLPIKETVVVSALSIPNTLGSFPAIPLIGTWSISARMCPTFMLRSLKSIGGMPNLTTL
jgi:hypothetical protein